MYRIPGSLVVVIVLSVPATGDDEARPESNRPPWQDAVSHSLPANPLTRRRCERAAAWLTSHALPIIEPGSEPPLRIIAWKDPTLEPGKPRLLAGYVITDTLWAAKALRLFDRATSQQLEESTQRLGWYGNGLHDVLFHPIDPILHRPADQDFVHGFSLGRRPTTEGRIIDLRVFRQKYDAKFNVGHPLMFAEHAVYQALFDFWQGRGEQARRRILQVIADDRTTVPDDRIFWDDRAAVLVDFVTYPDWLKFREGNRPVCRHFTFKLGVLLYAIRLMGMEQTVGPALVGMKERLWSAQTDSGGLAHFVDVGRDGRAIAGIEPTGEATAIGILAEVVDAKGP